MAFDTSFSSASFSAKTSASQMTSILPARRTCPRQRNRSATAGRKKFILNSTLTTSRSSPTAPRAAQPVLATVGLIQTVPSLALLAFLIPLLGAIGIWPALVALFLYALLPIVRNTHSGIADIAPNLRESAQALGISPGARLRVVELPLAARSILAGIKTSAVINVGTATIAAFIGAGGYGERIVTGLALNDNQMLLAGAIPAAALALLVHWSFELLDRRLIPAGMR